MRNRRVIVAARRAEVDDQQLPRFLWLGQRFARQTRLDSAPLVGGNFIRRGDRGGARDTVHSVAHRDPYDCVKSIRLARQVRQRIGARRRIKPQKHRLQSHQRTGTIGALGGRDQRSGLLHAAQLHQEALDSFRSQGPRRLKVHHHHTAFENTQRICRLDAGLRPCIEIRGSSHPLTAALQFAGKVLRIAGIQCQVHPGLARELVERRERGSLRRRHNRGHSQAFGKFEDLARRFVRSDGRHIVCRHPQSQFGEPVLHRIHFGLREMIVETLRNIRTDLLGADALHAGETHGIGLGSSFPESQPRNGIRSDAGVPPERRGQGRAQPARIRRPHGYRRRALITIFPRRALARLRGRQRYGGNSRHR